MAIKPLVFRSYLSGKLALANTVFRADVSWDMKTPVFKPNPGFSTIRNKASPGIRKAYDFTCKPLSMAFHVNWIDRKLRRRGADLRRNLQERIIWIQLL